LVVLAAVALSFYGAFGGDFLHWDDRMLLVDNQRWLGPDGWRWMLLDSSGGDYGPYMPLTWLSYRLDHAFHGMDARGFLITNLALHALAAIALMEAASRLLPRCSGRLRERAALVHGGALAAALLWALHPLRVEAVAWIAERRDVLSGALLMASLLVWLRHATEESGTRRAYWGALVLYALAMLSKSTPMGWPLVLLLLDVWPLRRGVTRATVVEKVPFAAVAALVAVAAWAGQADTGALAEISLPGRLVLGAHGAAFVALKSVLPIGLHTHYLRPIPFDAADTAFLIPAGLAVAGSVAVLTLARRVPALALAWASAVLLVAPVSGLVPIGSHAFADRYTYLAAIPLALLAAGGGAVALAARPRVAASIAAVAILSLGVASARLATTWRSTQVLFERVVAHEPDSWFAHFMLGSLAELRGEALLARAHYAAWVRLQDVPDAHVRLATAQLESGDAGGGVASLGRALELDPDHAAAHHVLGTYFALSGRTADAEREWRAALASDPGLLAARINLAALLQSTGREEEAKEHVRIALELAPANERAQALADSLGL
jgi:hypothetical protein